MELTVEKWGNGAAVRLPTELLGLLKVKPGDRLSVDVQSGGVLLKAARSAYALADLVAQCDATAAEPPGMVAWADMKPVGREAW